MVGEGGTVVQRGGVGVLVNNLHSQSPLAGPPLEESEDTTLVGLFFPLFFKNRKAIVLNEASTSIGELMACMRRSVWTVNLPALHQYDKQWCGVEEKAGKSSDGAFELEKEVSINTITSYSVTAPVTFSLQLLIPLPACKICQQTPYVIGIMLYVAIP